MSWQKQCWLFATKTKSISNISSDVECNEMYMPNLNGVPKTQNSKYQNFKGQYIHSSSIECYIAMTKNNGNYKLTSDVS